MIIDLRVINNFILQYAIEQLKLTLQWVFKLIQVFMINREYKWIYKEVYIEAIIKNDLQKLKLDVFKSVKYDTILEIL